MTAAVASKRNPLVKQGCPAFGRLLVVALRLLVGLVSLQLSGVPGVAAEMGLRFLDDGADDCCSDCPLEKGGQECPPGCPNCHCAHGGIALPTATESSTAPVANVGDDDVEAAPHETSIPRAPPLPGVYRPPRLTSSSV